MNFKTLATLTTLAVVPAVSAGPLAYAICQTGKRSPSTSLTQSQLSLQAATALP